MSGIGTLRETRLHAALKAWYSQPGDLSEAKVAGYIVDLLRGETVIEIQTHNFAALKRKLARLVERGPVRLVHPIAAERWIVRLRPDGQTVESRRRSPRRGHDWEIFTELVSLPDLLAHPMFSLEVLLIQEEEMRCPAPRARGRWRRDYRVFDRRLLAVVDRVVLAEPVDCLRYLPDLLPQPFTNLDLARAAGQPRHLAEKLTYCLRRMGVLEAAGRRGRAVQYTCQQRVHG
jgi:hypothetical protein